MEPPEKSPNLKRFVGFVFVASGVLIAAIFLAPMIFGFGVGAQNLQNNWSLRPNEWGDTLAGVFGSLSFVAITYGLWLQAYELRQTRAEMFEQTEQLKAQAKALESQIRLAETQAATAAANLTNIRLQSRVLALNHLRGAIDRMHAIIDEIIAIMHDETYLGYWYQDRRITLATHMEQAAFLWSELEKQPGRLRSIEQPRNLSRSAIVFGEMEMPTRADAFFDSNQWRGAKKLYELDRALNEVDQIRNLDPDLVSFLPPEVDLYRSIRDALMELAKSHSKFHRAKRA